MAGRENASERTSAPSRSDARNPAVAELRNQASTGITPIDLATNKTKPFVGVGVGNGHISSMLLAPDGSMAYVGRFAATKKGSPPLPSG